MSGAVCHGLEIDVQMATKEDMQKPGYEEGGTNSRIRITLTCQDVAPLEKGESHCLCVLL